MASFSNKVQTYPYYIKYVKDLATAKNTLSEAITIDSNHEDTVHRREAILRYKTAISQFQSCQRISLAGRIPQAEKETYESTKAAVERYIKNTSERVRYLVSKITPPPIKPIAASTTSSNKSGLLKGVEPKYGEMLLDTVLENTNTKFDDVNGNECAKRALEEAVIFPFLNPTIFTGLRNPTSGLLLFGPPGNGKTMLAKAVATESKCTFFNISAADLTDKFFGVSEKLIASLFTIARNAQPSIIFIDEIDSILTERSNSDSDVGRRIKTQFLIQLDGCATQSTDRILVMGATNRPFDLDEGVLRRFPKRIFIDLPDENARMQCIRKVLEKHNTPSSLTASDLKGIARATTNYTNADLTSLCAEASMVPLRSITRDKITKISPKQIRPLNINDFSEALKAIRPSNNSENLQKLLEFARKSGQISENSLSARS
uniref:AAA domain-containing protein n=1 Tax=Rhabditophanes sp. KR3021 TaxID=114890 RepID=A0AC35UHH4_9BILA